MDENNALLALRDRSQIALLPPPQEGPPLALRGLITYPDPRADDFNGPAELPDTPTDAWPGSEQKIAVLAERAALQQTLWHPDDGKGIKTA